MYSGGSQQVQELGTNIEEFKKIFETPSEFFNQKEYNTDLARDEIIDELKNQIKEEADQLISNEIMNLRKIFLKGKKDPNLKNQNRNRDRGPKEKFGTGENKLKDIPAKELLQDVSN